MDKTIISTTNAPLAIGPYSQAVRWNNLIFISGQLPIDPQSGEIVKGGIEAQTQQCLKNLREVLLSVNASLTTVLKTTLFIRNMDDFSKINKNYADFFNSDPPARSCVEVSRLPKDVLIEIEAIAYFKQI